MAALAQKEVFFAVVREAKVRDLLAVALTNSKAHLK